MKNHKVMGFAVKEILEALTEEDFAERDKPTSKIAMRRIVRLISLVTELKWSLNDILDLDRKKILKENPMLTWDQLQTCYKAETYMSHPKVFPDRLEKATFQSAVDDWYPDAAN